LGVSFVTPLILAFYASRGAVVDFAIRARMPGPGLCLKFGAKRGGLCLLEFETESCWQLLLIFHAQGGLEMSKLCICLAIVIFMSLTACGGTRYNWVPQADDLRPPNIEYEGTGIPDPNSEL
jgi:hypothetical protein